MKIIENHSPHLTESEIIINYVKMDKRLNRIIEIIKSHTLMIECFGYGAIHQIPIDEIFYFESVDGKTFLYTMNQVLEYKNSLMSLEKMLKNTTFLRISKSCLLNMSYLKCVAPIFNHRLEATLKNDEKLIISRNYIKQLKETLKQQ